MDSPTPYPPKYVMLNEQSGNLRPPPQRRNVPRYEAQRSAPGRNCCFRCACCCGCFLLIFVFVMSATGYFLYNYIRPQKPSYRVENFEVNAFNVLPDFSLSTKFTVTVRADNPNANIGFIYWKESSVAVFFSDKPLCSGQLPAFRQPSKNVTLVNIVLQGRNYFGSGLHDELLRSQKAGSIPLLVKVMSPVTVLLRDFPLRKILVYVNCSVVIDNLLPNHKVQILSTKYSYDVDF